MHASSRWFKQVVIVVAVLGLLTSAWPSMAQGEKVTFETQPIFDLKMRIMAGDLPPMINGGDTTCDASPSRPNSIIPGEMDWTMAVYQTFCHGYWDIFMIDRDSLQYNWWLTNDQNPDIEPNLNYSANRVVFSRRVKVQEVYWWRIFTINVDRSGLTQLTAGSGDYREPVWSPDGSKIVYAYRINSNSHWHIYSMNANGTNRTQLTNDVVDNTQPSWSPDGSKIAWIKGGTTGAIWIMDADGNNQQPLATNLTYAQNLRWSPDGTRLALDYDSDGDTMNELAIINADGTALHSVYDLNYPTDEVWLSGWAPDGQSLIYTPVSYISSGGQTYIAYQWVRRVTISGGIWDFFDNVTCANSLYVDWKPVERDLPVSQVEALPAWSAAHFAVSWSGHDVGPSGVASFDVQVRDGALGVWTNWITNTTQASAQFTGAGEHWYCFRSRARDNAFNLEAYPGGNGDTCTTIDLSPPASTVNSPTNAATPQFLVTWSGVDATSGIASYDLQYRDGELGTWIDWVTSTTQTSRQFNGQPGHTYYFQSRARDKAGNLEDYPDGDGDTHTTTPQYALTGTVKGNRDQTVALASAQTAPAALNAPTTDHRGNFALYYNISGTLSLTATRDIFGALPPMSNIIVSDVSSSPIVYLPPLDDQLTDSHFESGVLTTWNPTGELTPTITSTAHTGNYAVLLGGTVPSDTVSGGPYLSAIEQTITVPRHVDRWHVVAVIPGHRGRSAQRYAHGLHHRRERHAVLHAARHRHNMGASVVRYFNLDRAYRHSAH